MLMEFPCGWQDQVVADAETEQQRLGAAAGGAAALGLLSQVARPDTSWPGLKSGRAVRCVFWKLHIIFIYIYNIYKL